MVGAFGGGCLGEKLPSIINTNLFLLRAIRRHGFFQNTNDSFVCMLIEQAST
jgi:hypothetical protein